MIGGWHDRERDLAYGLGGLAAPVLWRWLMAVVMMMLSLGLALPDGRPHGLRRRVAATLSGFVGLGLMWWSVPPWGSMSAATAFWEFAVIAVVSAGATIASRSLSIARFGSLFRC